MKYFLLIVLIIMMAVVISAQDGGDVNEFGMTEEEMLERGEYLAHIAGCVSCHTPMREEYNVPPTEWSLEQLQTVGWRFEDTQDLENDLFAGGRAFELGPMGVIFTPNLTPDSTGLGDWTDEEIETAIRIGVNKDGRRLFPLMPYANFFNWAESDMQALIMFLRSVDPIENEVDRSGPTGDGIAPELVLDESTLRQTPPDGSDPVELGAYLVGRVMSCGDCHTPLDEETGIPNFEMFLGGGQAYEGPWGIIYGGNITPHDGTGLAGWEAEDYERVLREGLRPDGRRLILMPWQDYAIVSDEDMAAIAAYLQNMEPVDNEVPAPAIEEIFLEFVELETE